MPKREMENCALRLSYKGLAQDKKKNREGECVCAEYFVKKWKHEKDKTI